MHQKHALCTRVPHDLQKTQITFVIQAECVLLEVETEFLYVK